jgi:hypothetical protein
MQRYTEALVAASLVMPAVGCAVSDPGDSEFDGDEVLEQSADGVVEGDPVDEDLLTPSDEALAAMEAKIASADIPEDSPRHAACGQNGPNLQNEIIADVAIDGAANQRTGSSTGCGARGVLQPGDDARYFCFTLGSDGLTWTYLHNQRTAVRGWVRDDLLRNFGSFRSCGF